MNVEDMLEMVSRFNREVVGLPVLFRPTPIGHDRRHQCAKHLMEEISEFVDAHSVEEQADAMVDLVYVALGRLFEMGVLPGPAFEEVHRANLKRVRLSTAEGFKLNVGKPDDWVGPDLGKLMGITLEDAEWLIARKELGGGPDGFAIEHTDRVGGIGGVECTTRYEFPNRACFDEHVRVFDDREFFDPVMHPERHHAHDHASRERDALGESDVHVRRVPRYDVVDAEFKEVRKRPKILVLGHGRHGKDTACEMLRDHFGFSFTSSSIFCAEHVMLPKFREMEEQGGPVYRDAQDCYDHRHGTEHLAAPGYYNKGGNRAFWYDTIRDFNRPDATALGRAIFEKHDIYCGLRSAAEFHALRNAKVFDLVIWVDRSEHVPLEAKASFTCEPWMADYVLDNNGSLDDLLVNLLVLYRASIKELCVA